MTKDEAVSHFQTQKGVADALGIKQSSVAEWGECPPPLRQLQLHRITRGGLTADPDVIAEYGEPVLPPLESSPATPSEPARAA